MSATHADDIKRHKKLYINVFLLLLVLTVVTVAVSYLPLGVPVAIALALLVATVKGSLVARHFMHLISERRAIYATLILTGLFFIVLMMLPVLTHLGGIGTAGGGVGHTTSQAVEH